MEAVEAFYKLNIKPPKMEALEKIGCLVKNDVFHVGLNPADVLREAVIDVEMERYYLMKIENNPPFIHHDDTWEFLEPLLKIKNKTGFKLNINLSQRIIRLNILEEFVKVLTPIYHAFEKEGADVKIKFSCRYSQSAWQPRSWCLRHTFSEPAQDWKKEMAMD